MSGEYGCESTNKSKNKKMIYLYFIEVTGIYK